MKQMRTLDSDQWLTIWVNLEIDISNFKDVKKVLEDLHWVF